MKRPFERVFTVRMWRAELPARGRPSWRGAVYDVATGRTLYVAGPQEVGEHLAAALNAASDKLPRD